MFFFDRKKKKKLDAVMEICVYPYQNIHKRLDENRALLELLYREAPELMEKHFWVESWFMSQDVFLLELEKALKMERCLHMKNFPRPWPEKPNSLKHESIGDQKNQ